MAYDREMDEIANGLRDPFSDPPRPLISSADVPEQIPEDWIVKSVKDLPPEERPDADAAREPEWSRFRQVVSYLKKAVVLFPNVDSSKEPVDGKGFDDRVEEYVDRVELANAVSSQWSGNFWKDKHALLLDLDIEHVYVPSTTAGHGHLIIKSMMPLEAMLECLDVLAKHHVIQQGYVDAAHHRGSAWLRLPWIKKW